MNKKTKQANNTGTNEVHLEVNDEVNSLLNQNDEEMTENQNAHEYNPNKISKLVVKKGASEKIKLGADKKEAKIDPEKMKETVRNNHALNQKNETYGCCEACCLDTGCHYCFKTTAKSPLNEMGVGVSLYFKFIKYLMVFFFLFTLISLPIIFFCVTAARSSSEYEFDSLFSYLFSTTLGSMGLETIKCNYLNMSSLAQSESKTLNFKCDSGFLDLDRIAIGLAFDPSIAIKEWPDRSKDINSLGCSYYDYERFLTRLKAKCGSSDVSECKFVLEDDLLVDASAYIGEAFNLDLILKIFPIFTTVYCARGELNLLNKYSVEKKRFSLIIACLDAGIILLYFFMIISLKKSQNKASFNALRSSLSLSLYSLEFRNFPTNISKQKLIVLLTSHIEKQLKRSDETSKLKIVDVKLAEANKEINHADRKGYLLKKRNLAVRKYVSLYLQGIIEESQKSVTLNTLKTLSKEIEKEKSKAKKALAEIDALQKKIDEIESTISHTKQTTFKSAWITFETIHDRDLAYEYFFSAPVSLFCKSICSCCFDAENEFFKGRPLRCVEAPEPSNILWKNSDVSFFEKMLRRLTGAIITLVFLSISLVAIAYVKIKQSEISSKFPTYDCKAIKITLTQAEVISDYLSTTKLGYIECYCKKNILKTLDDVFNVNGEHKQICLEWVQYKTWTIAFPFIIVMIIVLINMIMQIIYRKLSQFEKYKYLSIEMASRVTKIFFSQFLNTGLIILILNIRLKKESSAENFTQNLIGGKYFDTGTDWYKNVGTVVCLTMAINVFSTPFIVLIFQFIRLCKRGWDQSFTCNRRNTKKKKQHEYEALYMGPEWMMDFRYSQVLNIVFVCFLYSPGLPILYFTTFLQLFLTYWLDKFLVLRVCKKPLIIDHKLENRVLNILYLIILIHLIFAIWMYGNDAIFNESIEIPFLGNILSKSQDFLYYYDTTYGNLNYVQIFYQYRIPKPQNYILDIVLALMILFFIMKLLFYTPVESIFRLCCKRCIRRNKYSANNELGKHIYYHALKDKHIKDDEILINYDLKEDKIDPDFKKRLMQRKENLETEKKRRESNKTKNKLMFKGIFSYDIRHNPNFKELFAIEAITGQESSGSSQNNID